MVNHSKQQVPYAPGYGVLGYSLPHSTIKLGSVVIHYKGQIARVDQSGRLVGPFLDPAAYSYVYETGTMNLAFRETPKEHGVLTVEYDWVPNNYHGAQVQLRQADGTLVWVSLEDLRDALTQAPKQV